MPSRMIADFFELIDLVGDTTRADPAVDLQMLDDPEAVGQNALTWDEPSYHVGASEELASYWSGQEEVGGGAETLHRTIVDSFRGFDDADWYAPSGAERSDHTSLAAMTGRFAQEPGIRAHAQVLPVGQLAEQLERGHRVVAAVDAAELWGADGPMATGSPGSRPDWPLGRAVWVTGLHAGAGAAEPFVSINDPARPSGPAAAPLGRFAAAAAMHGNRAIVVSPERAVADHRHHPPLGSSADGVVQPAASPPRSNVAGMLASIQSDPELSDRVHLETLAIAPTAWLSDDEPRYTSLLVDRLGTSQYTSPPWGYVTWSGSKEVVDFVEWGPNPPAGLPATPWRLPDYGTASKIVNDQQLPLSPDTLQPANARLHRAMPGGAYSWYRAILPGRVRGQAAPAPRPSAGGRRPRTVSLAKEAERLAKGAGFERIARRLAEQRQANASVVNGRVAIVGEFNRGKSTLTNRLIGTAVMPCGPNPTTRSFVEVTATSDDTADHLVVTWPDGAQETRPLNGSAWTGLTLGHAGQQGMSSGAAAGKPQLRLRVGSSWLLENGINLIDTPGANEQSADGMLEIRRAIAIADVVVLVVAAGAPFSLTEIQLLEDEVFDRHVPHIVVAVTRLDDFSERDRREVLRTIEHRVRAVEERVQGVGGAIPVLPASQGMPSAEADLDELRATVADLVSPENRQASREGRLRRQLVDELDAIRGAARSGAEQEDRSAAERQQAVQAAELRRRDDDAAWVQTRREFTLRRDRVVDKLKVSVAHQCDDLRDTLSLELRNNSGDLKRWWDEVLPLQLRRRLRTLNSDYQQHIARALEQDIVWLESQIATAYGPRRLVRRVGSVDVEPRILGDLKIEDLERRGAYSAALEAAAGIAGIGLAFLAGLPMPWAFGMGGKSVAAYLDARSRGQKFESNYGEISDALDRTISELREQYLYKVSKAINATYDESLDDASRARSDWANDEIDLLRTAVDGGAGEQYDWHAIEEEAAALCREISVASASGTALT